MAVAFILRGVPGSGKSTFAKRLISRAGGAIHSTDEFFMVDGEYRFDPVLLAEYHERNFQAFCQSLKCEVPVVVCDNCNVRRWQFHNYIAAAKAAGYVVVVITMPHPTAEVAAQRSQHNVPMENIQRMLERWEY